MLAGSERNQQERLNMKTKTQSGNGRAFGCIALFGILFLAGCDSGPDAAEVAAKYTEQTAQAIIEGSLRIAGALFLGLIINGILK